METKIVIIVLVVIICILGLLLTVKYIKDDYGPARAMQISKQEQQTNSDLTTAIWLGLSGPQQASQNKIQELQNKVDNYQPDPKYKHDTYLKICCQEAMKAVKLGTFGIGCCLVDGDGNIIIRGHNELMTPYFRSDRHGEMVVLDKFEDMLHEKGITKLPPNITLYTQLESCVMCLSRIANSGISKCYYGAPDNGGGMVHLMCNLPPTYLHLANRQLHMPADVSEEMVQLCMECFAITGAEVGQKLMERTGDSTVNHHYCEPMYLPEVVERSKADPGGFFR